MKFLNPANKKRDRKATEDAILSAASKLFAEKGFESTRTLEIAKEAGANEALITRYFGGKEGLLIALMKDQVMLKGSLGENCSELERFPTRSEVKDLKDGILTFFKNGAKNLELKQEFARIGCARAMVDPEMAEVIRTHIIDQHLPEMVKSLQTYFDHKIKKADLEAAAFLIMSVNFNMNFMGRKVYQMEDDRLDAAMLLVANSLQAYLTPQE
jgi:AcrR family transcriptional regulator